MCATQERGDAGACVRVTRKCMRVRGGAPGCAGACGRVHVHVCVRECGWALACVSVHPSVRARAGVYVVRWEVARLEVRAGLWEQLRALWAGVGVEGRGWRVRARAAGEREGEVRAFGGKQGGGGSRASLLGIFSRWFPGLPLWVPLSPMPCSGTMSPSLRPIRLPKSAGDGLPRPLLKKFIISQGGGNYRGNVLSL